MGRKSPFVAALLFGFTGLAFAAEGDRDLSGKPLTEPAKDSADESKATSRQDAGESESSRARNPRVLYITMKGCPACSRELARLRRPGGDFDGMRAMAWKIGATPDCHLQIVDQEAIPELIAQFNIHSFPTVICINAREIVRSFNSGCTTPLDSWTFGFLLKGENERPKGSIPEAARVAWTGNYPLRGNHWSIDADWNPTRDRVVSHLRGTHGSQISANYAIESWSYEELRSLHDDLHEREQGSVGSAADVGYYYSQPAANKPSPYNAGRKIRGF